MKTLNVEDIININEDNQVSFAFTKKILDSTLVTYNKISENITEFIEKIFILKNNYEHNTFNDMEFSHILVMFYDKIMINLNTKILDDTDMPLNTLIEHTSNNLTRTIKCSYKLSDYNWPTMTIAVLDNMALVDSNLNLTIKLGGNNFIILKNPLDISSLDDIIATLQLLNTFILNNVTIIESGMIILNHLKENASP